MRLRRAFVFRLLVGAAALGLIAGQVPDASAAPWYSQQFSATLVQTPPPGRGGSKRTGRLFVGDAALRFELAAPGPVYIYDVRRDRRWILFPDQRRYAETKGAGPLADFLPRPGGNPCAGIPATGVTCRRTGTERVNGRVADRWEVQLQAGGRKFVGFRWVDRQLGVPVRLVTYEGARVDLLDIRTGPQPPSLFRLPADYRPAR
ncbi:MAG: hypothetical protein QN193_10270 [Armatimonadota bacterium]|nr:hypothetical protein [Armatimonadota bacterium]MDR7570981.1 hypothetical protein [Armatimonadota bacterium]MDR7614749.1 hypothetical protein [Armatimonadota bacterium]